MLKPANDYLQVEVVEDTMRKQFDKNVSDAHTSGIVVGVPDKLNYFGFHSFAFEDSFMARDKLDALLADLKSLVGKRVWWLALQEKGAVLHDSEAGKTYVFIKATSIMAIGEPDDDVYSVLDSRGGAFSV
jgi:hypothetical protein